MVISPAGLTLHVCDFFFNFFTCKSQVKSQEGKAQWIADRQALVVTLPVNREFAFLYNN